MKLSKCEARYRTKIIQEWNLNKKEQKQLDNSVKMSGKNYCSFYADAISGLTNGFFASLSLQRASEKLYEIGTTVQEAADAFGSFRDAWDALGKSKRKMYGFISGISDANDIYFCPFCGEKISCWHAGGTATCNKCWKRFGAVEVDDGDK